MASVLVLILALFCGVYTASLPDPDALDSKLESTLDGKLDSTLDGLDEQLSDNIKQTVLEGVKKLLDSQLAALVKDKGRHREVQRQSSKSRTSSLLIPKPRDRINQEFSSSEQFQDTGVDTLTNAVDELLKENKNIILEDKDEIILDNDVDNMLDLVNSTDIDNAGIISGVGYDKFASQLVKHIKKDRKGSQSQNRKKGNRVIVDRLSKINEKYDDPYKSEDNFEEKLNRYDENVKTLSDSDDDQLESRKNSNHNKVRKNRIDLNENGRNIETYINRLEQLIKKENDSEIHKNRNINLVHPIYQRGQKYGRRVHGRGKTLPEKYLPNGNRHKYYKLAKKPLPQTITSNIDVRKSRYNDVNGKQRDEQKSLQNELSKFGVAQGKHEKNNINDAYLTISKENANNNEQTDLINKDEVKDKLGKGKESGDGVKNSVTWEKQTIAADKNDNAKVKGYRTKKLRKANQIESDESVDEKSNLQKIEDNATTDARDHAHDEAEKEEIITKTEEDITETENTTSEKENVAGETKDEKETDKDYILDFLESTQNTDTNKNAAKDKHKEDQDKNVSKKDNSRNCRHESDESKILRELIQNNDIKKSFSFSLNFTSQ